MFSFVYLVSISVLKLLVGSRRPAQVKDIELIVLRLGSRSVAWSLGRYPL